MKVATWRMAVLLSMALAALWRPVVRFCVRMGGRLGYWQSQAEIGWLLAAADRATRRQQQRAGK